MAVVRWELRLGLDWLLYLPGYSCAADRAVEGKPGNCEDRQSACRTVWAVPQTFFNRMLSCGCLPKVSARSSTHMPD